MRTAIATDVHRRSKVDLVSDELRKLILHREKLEPGNVLAFEFDEHVEVAVSTKIAANTGAEQRQSADVMTPAEVGD